MFGWKGATHCNTAVGYQMNYLDSKSRIIISHITHTILHSTHTYHIIITHYYYTYYSTHKTNYITRHSYLLAYCDVAVAASKWNKWPWKSLTHITHYTCYISHYKYLPTHCDVSVSKVNSLDNKCICIHAYMCKYIYTLIHMTLLQRETRMVQKPQGAAPAGH